MITRRLSKNSPYLCGETPEDEGNFTKLKQRGISYE